MIKINKLVKRYANKTILADINLYIPPARTQVIMGASGCGKSTLIRCLNKLIMPCSGEIYVQGQDIYSPESDTRALRKNIGFVFQNYALFRHLSLLENVSLGLRILTNASKKAALERASHELAKVGMEMHGHKYPSHISGGQKQRVALARALALDPAVIIFDEPTSALDPVMTREVGMLINQLRQAGTTVVCVTHDVGLASLISDDIAFLHEGVISAQGSFENLRDSPIPFVHQFFNILHGHH
ncbi:amino acid ABC transporter ATP-binding protein [Burkholderia ubonensis]|uniref:amino acid ABC transporter ATP-binding protein n=1 Tax=Burkholderia ubonensis TaxID=101571 RepID=UPI0009B33F57|nr:amino acid ABC transporter ATP-binding protein [Burkholderia ubonensis]